MEGRRRDRHTPRVVDGAEIGVWQWRDFFEEVEESCSPIFVRKIVRVRWDEEEGAFRHPKFSDAVTSNE